MAGPGAVPGTPGTGRLFVGTSGFSYPAWAPRFYPPGTRSTDLLAAYGDATVLLRAQQHVLPAPDRAAIAAWCAATPAGFRFAVKAQRGGSLRALLADPIGHRRLAHRAVPPLRGQARLRPVPGPGGGAARRRAPGGPAGGLAGRPPAHRRVPRSVVGGRRGVRPARGRRGRLVLDRPRRRSRAADAPADRVLAVRPAAPRELRRGRARGLGRPSRAVPRCRAATRTSCSATTTTGPRRSGRCGWRSWSRRAPARVRRLTGSAGSGSRALRRAEGDEDDEALGDVVEAMLDAGRHERRRARADRRRPRRPSAAGRGRS